MADQKQEISKVEPTENKSHKHPLLSIFKRKEVPREKTWPQFRGHNADGIGSGDIPLTWDEKTNVAWRTKIPGVGHSSPIVWGDNVFVTTAVPKSGKGEVTLGGYDKGYVASAKDRDNYEFKLVCIDGRNGKIRWAETAQSDVPKFDRHPKSSFANPTPATDGQMVVASFGPDGLYAYNFKGKQVWRQDLGKVNAGFYGNKDESQWGFSSSPIITPDKKVIVQVDGHPNYELVTQDSKGKDQLELNPKLGTNSYIAAFDLKTGKKIWQTPRVDLPTFSSPTYVRTSADGEGQVVVNGYNEIAGYNARTGKKIWGTKGYGDIPISTPVYVADPKGGSGVIIFSATHGGKSALMAISADAKGDNVTAKAINAKTGDYVPTPVVNPSEGVIYSAGATGMLGAYDIHSPTLDSIYPGGKRQRIAATSVSSSPVIAQSGGKSYVLVPDEDGNIHVMNTGKDFKEVANNPLPGANMASPAIANGTIYIRSGSELFAIRKAPINK